MTTEVLSHQTNGIGKTVINAKFTWFTSDGSSVSSTITSECIDKSEHGTAKALSIAQRMAIIQMFLIPTDDRAFLEQKQFQQALLRINGGDKELFSKLQKEFKIKKDHLSILEDASKKSSKK